jgi:hypothetical protein
MHCFSLAFAESPESSNVSLVLVLAVAGIVGAAALLAAMPVLISRRRRRHRRNDAVLAFAIVWAVLAAGSGIYAVAQYENWSRERTMRIESGYYDPREADRDAPRLPWVAWTALACGYGALIAWSGVARRVIESG